jgi:hypothetical protein
VDGFTDTRQSMCLYMYFMVDDDDDDDEFSSQGHRSRIRADRCPLVVAVGRVAERNIE